MRKRKRAMDKLKTAKRQANAHAENSDMSEREKLKVRLRWTLLRHVFRHVLIVSIFRPFKKLCDPPRLTSQARCMLSLVAASLEDLQANLMERYIT